MSKVTKESLIMRIAYMSSRPLSLNEEYQLEAYEMLLERLTEEEQFSQALDEFEAEE